MKRLTLILFFCLVLSACSAATRPSIVAPTLSQTPALAKDTPTRRPSKTPGPTETDFPFHPMPTSTSLVPTPLAGSRYRLTHWTPQLANDLIETLRRYPENLGLTDRGYHDFGYYYAYQYAAFAERETRLYFPNPSFGEAWAWDAIYNMAQYGDEDALTSYADLIDQSLKTGKTSIDHLPAWFNQHETRFMLKVSQVGNQPESYVLEISDLSESYGGFLWAVRDGGSTFKVYPLIADRPGGYGDFQAASSTGIAFDLRDVTGDGVAEIITSHFHFPGSGDALTTAFNVFDISSGEPEKLEFDRGLRSIGEKEWSVLEENHRSVGFAFDNTFDRITCPLVIHYEYRWDGEKFAQTVEKFPSLQEIRDHYTPKCLDEFGSYQLLKNLHSGGADALKVWDDFLSDWPHIDPVWDFEDKEFPQASRDKAYFTAGMQLALDGYVDAARHEMSLIVEKPTIPNSPWIDRAKTFLANFHRSTDMSQTCLALKLCPQFTDVEKLIELAGTPQPQDIINFLQQSGMLIGEHGTIDINNDGQMDQWVDIGTTPDAESGRWIFISSKNGYQPVLLGYSVVSMEIGPAFRGSPVLLIDQERQYAPSGIEVDALETDPITSKIETFNVCARLFYGDVDDVEFDLFNGGHPSDAIKKLSNILSEMALECKTDGYLYSAVQARYLLAVAYDLSGDATHAVENYLMVWQSFPDAGPYPLMAQAKLEPVP